MKILFVNTLYYPNIHGGAEKSVQLLAEELVRKGIDAVVVTLGEKYNEYSHNGVKVYVLEYKNLYPLYSKKEISFKKIKTPIWHAIDIYNFGIKKTFSEIISKESPDLVHTNTITGFSVSIWDEIKKKNIPILHTLRNYYLMCVTTILYSNGKICDKQCNKCLFYTILKKQISQKVDCVVGISDFILNKHLDNGYFKKSKSHVIYNSIEKVNHNLEINNKEKKELVFGYIGALHYYKGIEFVLKQFNSKVNNKLYIAGKGEEDYEKYLQSNYNSSNIIFLGWQKIEDFFSNIDILIVPTLGHEPFGRIVIEAYSHGIPVIGSNKGGITEIIKEKETGVLFSTEEDNSLINAIDFFTKNIKSLEKIKSNCLEYSKTFDSENITKQYIELYLKCINEH